MCIFFILLCLPPSTTRTDPPFPYTSLFRSPAGGVGAGDEIAAGVVGEAGDAAVAVDGLGEPSGGVVGEALGVRSEEHTSELQSLMRISYAVFCLKKTKRF